MAPVRTHHTEARPRVPTPWDDAADNWALAVRGKADAARSANQQALLGLIRQVPTGPILDAGCGEGWLERALAGHRSAVTAFDGSREMVTLARVAGPDSTDYRELTFDEAAADPRKLGGAFGTIVFSFSLLQERITPVLEAAAAVLFPYGRVLIQAAHPSQGSTNGTYRDGWRVFTESAPGIPLPVRVPWYFRTFSLWILELRRAGLLLVETYEPLDPTTGRPASLLIHATIPERRKREVVRVKAR
jgi:SAM-dependent methyltransferase